MIEFVFMLTRDDRTVDDAPEVLAALSGSGLRYVGFKDVGAAPDRQRELTARAHDLGMEVMLEVVSTSREDEAGSLRSARGAGVDWVLGGTNPDLGLEVLAGSGIRYCPFAGAVAGHPSVLGGDVDEIADHARELTSRDGVAGVDLLTYRHPVADPEKLTAAVARAAAGVVIAAGSVVTDEQIALLARAGAWGFTIGSAVFDGSVPGRDVRARIDRVLDVAAAC